MFLDIPALPASLPSLLSWVTALATQQLTPSTVKSYLGGVRSFHVDAGFPQSSLEIFHAPLLKRLLAGLQRENGRQRRERQPITRDILLRLVTRYTDRDSQREATFRAAFSLAFAAFLRVGEFTYTDRNQPGFATRHMTRGGVTFTADNSIDLLVPASKTDPFGNGVVVKVASTGDAACPVENLRHLFDHFPASPEAPLFTLPEGNFTREAVVRELQSSLRALGFSGQYSGHSFRRGAATAARDAGLSDSEIMALGRWKSDAFRLYIDVKPSYLLAASRRHQGALT